MKKDTIYWSDIEKTLQGKNVLVTFINRGSLKTEQIELYFENLGTFDNWALFRIKEEEKLKIVLLKKSEILSVVER